jgi:hypothetical protein
LPPCAGLRVRGPSGCRDACRSGRRIVRRCRVPPACRCRGVTRALCWDAAITGWQAVTCGPAIRYRNQRRATPFSRMSSRTPQRQLLLAEWRAGRSESKFQGRLGPFGCQLRSLLSSPFRAQDGGTRGDPVLSQLRTSFAGTLTSQTAPCWRRGPSPFRSYGQRRHTSNATHGQTGFHSLRG